MTSGTGEGRPKQAPKGRDASTRRTNRRSCVRYIMEGFNPKLLPGTYAARLIVTPASYGVIDFVVTPA